MDKKLTTKQLHDLAVDIIEWLQKHDMFTDINIYVNGLKYSDDELLSDLTEKTKLGYYYVFYDYNPEQYFEYCNPDTLTMSFEGPLYDMLNYSCGDEEEDFKDIFRKYGLYYELGNSWNLSAYFC